MPVAYLRERGVDLLVAHGLRPPRIEGGRAEIDPATLLPTVRRLLSDPEFASQFGHSPPCSSTAS